jgi:hypothetical protein
MSLIDAYTTETVTITPKGTLSKFGTYDKDGTAVTTRARVLDKSGVRRSNTSDEIVYSKVMWLRPTDTIALLDQVTHDGVNHEVIDIVKPRDIAGVLSHIKVFVRVV